MPGDAKIRLLHVGNMVEKGRSVLQVILQELEESSVQAMIVGLVRKSGGFVIFNEIEHLRLLEETEEV